MNTLEYDPFTGHPGAVWHEAQSISRRRLTTLREIGEFRGQVYALLFDSAPCRLARPHAGDVLFTARHSDTATTLSAAIRCTNPRCISSLAP
ncbi:hypothetical protein [Streptomyces sp. H39-C1]|uniref:hypothetical protein n=1 Tax=Streptomyces sp. H39-C1 TaxID=3004355 RepID=UPI0022AF1D36|nr:hypothetical protein [Streptomyces sp. H39-C1]MCZ4101058.1 hypothetical protein [Streptomyces sp. H39-C1]